MAPLLVLLDANRVTRRRPDWRRRRLGAPRGRHPLEPFPVTVVSRAGCAWASSFRPWRVHSLKHCPAALPRRFEAFWVWLMRHKQTLLKGPSHRFTCVLRPGHLRTLLATLQETAGANIAQRLPQQNPRGSEATSLGTEYRFGRAMYVTFSRLARARGF